MKTLVVTCLLPVFFSLSAFGAADLRREVKDIVEAYLKTYQIPGAVVLVGHGNDISFHQAYGTYDGKRPLEKEAIYDLASITKLFTATAFLKVLEAAGMNLATRISDVLPGYGRLATQDLTFEDLLRHQSGMRAVPGADVFGASVKETWGNILSIDPQFERGEFRYSDVNYLALGKALEKLYGGSLDLAVKKLVLAPLEMEASDFQPAQRLSACKAMCAPTGGALGEVHDPVSRKLGGVAGHAGLFASAGDLAKFAAMFLNEGHYRGKAIISRRQFKDMTYKRAGSSRGLGFDFTSRYSVKPRGEFFAKGLSFGHTGYTGTSLWIDPTIDTYLIVLSNPVQARDWRYAKKGLLKMVESLANVVGRSFSY